MQTPLLDLQKIFLLQNQFHLKKIFAKKSLKTKHQFQVTYEQLLHQLKFGLFATHNIQKYEKNIRICLVRKSIFQKHMYFEME